MNQENTSMNRHADELRQIARAAAGDLDFARYTRVRRRRATAMLTLAVVGFVLILASTALLTRIEPDRDSPITPATTISPPPTTVDPQVPALPAFVPETRHWGTSTIVPLGFVDGTTAELSYPDDYDFLSKGIELLGAFGDSGTSRTFSVRYGTIAENVARERAVTGRAELLATYPDSHGGTAELWSFAPDDTADYLFVSFGNWTLKTWDYHANRSEARDETLGAWVQSLGGYIADNGYPVLGGGGSLAITPVLGDSGGPDGPDLRLDGADGSILLYPDQCQYVTGDGYNSYTNSLEWCDVPTNTRVVAFGNSSMALDLMDNLAIAGVTNRTYEATLTQKPYVVDDRTACGDLPDHWQDGFTQIGPLWLRSLASGVSGDRASKTIATLVGGQQVTLTVPLGWTHQVSHLFDPSQWNQGNYRVNPDHGAVTFRPCDGQPAQYIGGFVFKPRARCAPFELAGAVEGMVTVSLDGEPCDYSWARHSDPDKDFTITYPSDWFVAPETLTPALGFPMTVAVSSFEAPVGGDCPQFANAAFDAIGPTDVLLTIHELGAGYVDQPRPADFRAEASGYKNPDFAVCITDPGRLQGGEFRYLDNGRGFDVILAMGEDVSQEDEDAAWAMLSSFVPVAIEPEPDFCTPPEELTANLLSHAPGAPAFPDDWKSAENTLPLFTDPNITALSIGSEVACARIWTATSDSGETFQLVGMVGGGTNAAGYVQMTSPVTDFSPNMSHYWFEGLGNVELQRHDDGTYTGRFNGDDYIGIALNGWALDFFVDVWDEAMSLS